MGDRVIFDLGANVGLNLPYYLSKAERVVAVEPNPTLARRLKHSFAGPIATGHLAVVECAVTSADRAGTTVEFFVYEGPLPNGHVASSLHPPEQARTDDFRRIEASTIDIATLVSDHGEPWFVKIDLEHHDSIVLEDLLASGLRPPLLSVEAHDPSVVALLLLADEYRGFKLVRGRTVHNDFIEHPVRTLGGIERLSFPKHSAGPFGEDLPGPWMDRASLLEAIGRTGLGWVDVHGSTLDAGEAYNAPFGDRSPEGVVAPLRRAVELATLAVARTPRAVIRRLSRF